tara:strand:+ start:652 stop:927 length:276 start_codon:yes stop_codon:yes gene_type:complete
MKILFIFTLLCNQAHTHSGYGPAILLALLLLPAPIIGLIRIHLNNEWDEQREEIREMFGLKSKEKPYDADEHHKEMMSGKYDMFRNKYKNK